MTATETRLTADAIRAMPAGPRLDALVAQHVFGWRWQRCEYIGPSPVRAPVIRYNLMLPGSNAETWRCTPSDDESQHKIQADHWPSYSTEIAAAWTVAEKSCLGMARVNGGWTVFRLQPGAEYTVRELNVWPFGWWKSAPEGICKAALIDRMNLDRINREGL